VKRAPLLVLCLMLMSTAALAQGARVDVAGSLAGVFGETVTGNGIQQKQTNSAGGLLSFRYFFGKYAGVEANYGYTRNSQNYSGTSIGVVGVQAGVHELTGALVLRYGPKPVQPFVLVGGGLLMFHPTSHAISVVPLPIGNENHGGLLYGGGADLKMVKAVGLRVQVRGLRYQAPEFHVAPTLHTGQTMNTIEPTVGLVFKF
jgi:outer membrane protein W